MPMRFVTENNLLVFYVSVAGCVFFAINNKLEGIVLDISKPIWGIFDIYGNTTSLELVELECESLGLEMDLPEGPVHLPSNMQHSAKISLEIRDQITPICFSATMGNGLNCRKGIHLTRKDGVLESTLAFTDTALRSGQTAYFYCARASEYPISLIDLTRFGVGVTTCDPTSIPIPEIPYDSMELMERPEYWKFSRDFEDPEQGEYFALSVNRGGYLSYTRPRVDKKRKKILFNMDISRPLYIVIDLCGKVSSVAAVGMSTETSLFGKSEASPSGVATLLPLDFMSCDPAESLNSFSEGSFLDRCVTQQESNDPDMPGTSNYRDTEMQNPIPDRSTDKRLLSGVYIHKSEHAGGFLSSVVAAGAGAASGAPIGLSVLSWLGQRVAPSEAEENIYSQHTSNDSSADEILKEAFYYVPEESESSCSSDELCPDMSNNTRTLEMLTEDLEEIRQLGPTEGAVDEAIPVRVDDERPDVRECGGRTSASLDQRAPHPCCCCCCGLLRCHMVF